MKQVKPEQNKVKGAAFKLPKQDASKGSAQRRALKPTDVADKRKKC